MTELATNERRPTPAMYFRKGWATLNVAIGTTLYAAGEAQAFPDSLESPFDLDNHAKHVLPSFILGACLRVTFNSISKHPAIASTAVVGALGSIFETGWVDSIWYRNTTRDVVDVLYTVLGGVAGAISIKQNGDTSAKN